MAEVIKLTYDTPEIQVILDSVANKVDKIPGMGLTTNDYTNTAKAKVDAITDSTRILYDYDEYIIDGGKSGVI